MGLGVGGGRERGGGGPVGDSAGLEEQYGQRAQVEVDEVLGLVRDVAAEVLAHDAVPGGVEGLVELLLDEGGNVLSD